MTLSEYLKSTETTATAFAQMLRVPPSTVTRWLAGSRTPQIRYIPEIEAITGGKVTLADFLSEKDDDSRRAAE